MSQTASGGAIPALATSAPPTAFVEYPIPSANSNPNGIATGPDGAVWFAEDAEGASKIGRISSGGSITEYSTGLDPNSGPFAITSGPGNQMWFTESGFTDTCGTTPNGIGSITTDGTATVTNYTAGFTNCAAPYGIATGADGNIWFTEYNASGYGKMTTSGAATEFSNIATSSAPALMAAGPDGNLWFPESAGGSIVRAATAGNPPTATQFPDGNGPYGITAGPDGNLWFTDCSGDGTQDAIGKIDVLGNITYYTANLTAASCPIGITTGPDGNIWFTEFSGNNIGRITVTGTITEFAIPTANAVPYFITTGTDGKLYFTEAGVNQIGVLDPTALGGNIATPTPAPSATPCFDPDGSQEKHTDKDDCTGATPPPCTDKDDVHQNPAHPNRDVKPDKDCAKGPPAPKVRHTPKPPGPKPHPTPKPTPTATPKPH
jgi:virginiamycin B lyase